jgi:site-specific recombinase XerD
MTEIEKIIEKEFDKREFKVPTRKIYKKKLLELFKFYDQFDPKELTFIQIESFIFNKKRKESPSSTGNSFWAFKMFYNEVLGKDYPFYKIRLPKTESTIPEILSQE